MTKFEITEKQANQLILKFLIANGFEENAIIKRLDYTYPYYVVIEKIYYHGETAKRMTVINNYTQLLQSILKIEDESVCQVIYKQKRKTRSYIIQINTKDKCRKRVYNG